MHLNNFFFVKRNQIRSLTNLRVKQAGKLGSFLLSTIHCAHQMSTFYLHWMSGDI